MNDKHTLTHISQSSSQSFNVKSSVVDSHAILMTGTVGDTLNSFHLMLMMGLMTINNFHYCSFSLVLFKLLRP